MSAYFSVTKFGDTILEKDLDASVIALFFEPREAKNGNYDNFIIRPIGLVIRNKNFKELCFAHPQLLDFFEGKQVILSVPNSFNKKIPEDDELHYLEIRLNKITWSGGYYYYSVIYKSNNKEVNDYLLDSKVNLFRRTESQVNIGGLSKANFQ